jgi:hypothetical protein
MGIGPQAVNLTVSLWLQGALKGFRRVVELGSQELVVDTRAVTRELRAVTTNPGLPEVDSARSLYEALGFEEYRCIDTDGRHGALVLDLNQDLRAGGYREQFDLVTNHGTTEHCFDQHHAFRNVHNLCAKNGLMLHALPFQGYVNHGFYNYHPNFYRDLAASNGYELVTMLLNVDAGSGDLSLYSAGLMGHIAMTSSSTLALFVVLRKTTDDEFRVPFQGMYSGVSLLADGYEFQRVPPTYLDMREIAWEVRLRELLRILVVRAWRKAVARLGLGGTRGA